MNETDPALLRNAAATAQLRALVARLDAADIGRSVGGDWTVGLALAHLAFWDVRQDVALQRFGAGDEFPSEDVTTNATLVAMAPLFRSKAVGEIAVSAAERLDATLQGLTAEQRDSLREAGLGYAIDRWQHREEHLAQIDAVLA